MSFNSFNFWLVYPFIWGGYWLIPNNQNKLRKTFLILASYLLYTNWKPSFALILLGVTLITYFGGILINQSFKKEINNTKVLFGGCILLGILPLLIFKYYSFINENINVLLKVVGLQFVLPGLNITVPVGISFFTFQAIGYMLDVYHGRVKSEQNLLDYMLFVSFFPQITAGPISTAEELMPQIKAIHIFDYKQARKGLQYLLWGMFIKLVIADRLGLFVDVVYANYVHYNGTTCFLASVFYSLQIYCDFAGYSLMAIGIARTLGFNLPDNFRRPYFAISITEFWKRWHITLTRFLTRHIYIALGGNRHGRIRTYRNILVTFLVSGIWHGANWTFIVWGFLHGIIQIIEKSLGWQEFKGNNKLIKIFRILVTFLLVDLCWIFFRMPKIHDALNITCRIFTNFGRLNLADLDIFSKLILLLGIIILCIKEIGQEFFPQSYTLFNFHIFRWTVYVFLFIIILTLGVLDSGQFLYVNF